MELSRILDFIKVPKPIADRYILTLYLTFETVIEYLDGFYLTLNCIE